LVFPKLAAAAPRAILAQEGHYFPIGHMGKVYNLRLAAGAVPAHIRREHSFPVLIAGKRLVDDDRRHEAKKAGSDANLLACSKWLGSPILVPVEKQC